MNEQEWIKRIKELQALAQAGLYYTHDRFDEERFERIRMIAAEMLASLGQLPIEQVQHLFCEETGYQTPKIDTRALIVKEHKILLVQESDGLWSLPGGWCDVTCSVRENTIKEVKEEAGLEVRYERLLAVLDPNHSKQPPYAYSVAKFFSLCSVVSGQFEPNIETIASGYFDLDHLPPLSIYKVNEQQLRLCMAQLDTSEVIVQ